VSQKEGWTEHNFGHGGTGYLAISTKTNAPNYLDVLDEVAASNPNVVVVAGGLNDLALFREDRGAVSQAVTDVFKGLRNRLPGARIIAVGPSDPDGTTVLVIALDLAVQQAASVVGGEYVSLLAPTPVLGADMYNPADPGHPNDLGYAAIADRFVSALLPA
jgi:lysophospholipase L1-like esterase